MIERPVPPSIAVLKFGGSVLGGPDDVPRAVPAIEREVRAGRRVVAVVSAFARTTDRLLREANRRVASIDDAGDRDHAIAAILATGEEEAAARMLLALRDARIPAAALGTHRLVRTAGPILDADPVSVDRTTIRSALDGPPVVVVPGFVGYAADGRPTLLGRGGSDLTAIVIGHALDAPVRLLKGIDGVYERDPATPGAAPARFAAITFADALELDAAIVQRKALRFAARHGTPFELGAIDGPPPTRIGAPTTRPHEGHRPGRSEPRARFAF